MGLVRVTFDLGFGFRFHSAMDSSPPSKRRRKNLNFDDPFETLLATSSSVNRLSPVVVFAHGAGAPSSSEWIVRSFSDNFFNVLALTLFVSSSFIFGVQFS